LAEALAFCRSISGLMGRLMEILAEDGWFARSEAGWRLQKEPPQVTAVSLENRWQAIHGRFPQFDAEIEIAQRCAQSLAPP
jgi:hypothetical protein